MEESTDYSISLVWLSHLDACRYEFRVGGNVLVEFNFDPPFHSYLTYRALARVGPLSEGKEVDGGLIWAVGWASEALRLYLMNEISKYLSLPPVFFRVGLVSWVSPLFLSPIASVCLSVCRPIIACGREMQRRRWPPRRRTRRRSCSWRTDSMHMRRQDKKWAWRWA